MEKNYEYFIEKETKIAKILNYKHDKNVYTIIVMNKNKA